MSKSVRIGDLRVGEGEPCFLIAEIGINHNGSVEIAKKLIDLAVEHKFHAVKFQKRTVDVVYTPEDLARPRETPFGQTNGELKRGLEFGVAQYREIDAYCRSRGVLWFASPWDVASVEFLEQFQPPCHKIASACLTDRGLLGAIRATGRPVILSTGMSTLEQVDAAVAFLKDAPLMLMHTVSTYPAKHDELNLAVIGLLKERYRLPVGYSGHEPDVIPTVMAVVGFGACAVERHVTLDRSMWGTDQSASLEPRGMELVSKYIRTWPTVRGDGIKRVAASEVPIAAKLRRVLDL
ncbi:MAG: N-acetylneuraminate synthase family protein [Proteobacteria bacterium]|nr:N-acetylneuraminate synthase family protein [Pseudomonadota bacterium]